MKPFRHPFHLARPPVRPAIALFSVLWALGLPCAQAAVEAAAPSAPAAAAALEATQPVVPDAAATTPAVADETPPSDFEDVLREQDPAEVPLSMALMGGVLGIVYVGRRKKR